MLSRCMTSSRLFVLDGRKLLTAIISETPTLSEITPQHITRIALSLPNQENSVAQMYLRLVKTIGGFRYYGFRESIRQTVSANLTTSAATATAPAAATNSTVAKVPFMITSKQRAQLQRKLDFSVEDIKQLTPLEAAVVLEFELSVGDCRGGKRVLNEKVKIWENRTQQQQQTDAAKSTSWYAVFHSNLAKKDERPERVALFKTEHEAMFFQTTKQKLSTNKFMKYTVNQVVET